MSGKTILQQLENFRAECIELVQYRSLHTYTGGPEFTLDRLFFLLLPMFEQNNWQNANKNAAMAVALITRAIEEHDRIFEKQAITKNQQLIVLAGDYYSGIYYRLLAKNNYIVLLSKLSEKVIEISEKKSLNYGKETLAFEQWVDNIRVIETSLISQYYDYFGWYMYTQLANHVLILQTLKRKLLDNDSFSSSQLQQAIEKVKRNIENQLNDNTYLCDESKQFIQQYFLLND